jgi:hypothetical protein
MSEDTNSNVESPPPADQPQERPLAPADRLRELCREYLRTRDRAKLMAYLRDRQ